MLVIIENDSLDFCLYHLPYNLSISRKREPIIPAVRRLQLSLTLARRHHDHAEFIPRLTLFSLYCKNFSPTPRKHCKTRSCKQNPWLPQLPSMATETPSPLRKIWAVSVGRHDLSQDWQRREQRQKADFFWKQYRIFFLREDTESGNNGIVSGRMEEEERERFYKRNLLPAAD